MIGILVLLYICHRFRHMIPHLIVWAVAIALLPVLLTISPVVHWHLKRKKNV